MIFETHRVLGIKGGRVIRDSVVYQRFDLREDAENFHENWVDYSDRHGKTYEYTILQEWEDGDPEGEDFLTGHQTQLGEDV